jgi:hypothetical protein
MKVDIVMACMILGERFRLKQGKTGCNGSTMTTPSKSRFVRVPITTKVASSNLNTLQSSSSREGGVLEGALQVD